jgi:hypothetical protein
MRIRQRSAEKLGCALVLKHQSGLEFDVCASDSSNIALKIGTRPIRINIAATHVPHAGHSLQRKSSHYELLSQHLRKCSNHEINMVLGDFNARLSEQLPEEAHVIGKHIYRTSTSTLEDLSEQQRQNRQLFVDFCLTHKLIPMNTWFEKPTPKLTTYHSTTTTHLDLSGVNTATHAQLDYILINDTWRNSIKNIYNIHETLLDSDHALVVADMHVRFASKNKRQNATQAVPKFRKPTRRTTTKIQLVGPTKN